MASGGENTSYDYVDSTASKNTEIYQDLEMGTSSEVKKETKKLISKGQDILRFAEDKAKKNPRRYDERYRSTIKEYEDLRKAAIASLKDDRKVTQDELLLLKEEFRDIRNISLRPEDIDNKVANSLEDGYDHVTNEVQKETFKHTPWQLYSLNDARKALSMTQESYKPTRDWLGFTNTVASIDNNKERDAFQRKIIGHIEKKYPKFLDTHIETYDEASGYQLKKIEDADRDAFENIAVDNCDNPETLHRILGFSQSDFGGEAGRSRVGILTNKLNEISNNRQRNALQEKIIRNILGNELGYNDTLIQGYNHEERGGNYLVSIEEFEASLNSQNPNEWNSTAVAKYFTKEAGNLDMTKVISLMGIENVLKLQELWSTTDSEKGIAKKILEDNPDTKWMIEGIANINVQELITQKPKIFSQIVSSGNDELKGRIPEIIAATRKTNFISEHSKRNLLTENNISSTEVKIIVETRKESFETDYEKKREKLLTDLGPRFGDNKEIMQIFREKTDIKFDDSGKIIPIDWKDVIDEVNIKIDRHNKQKGVKKIERIEGKQKDIFIKVFEGLNNIHLQVEYTKSLAVMDDLISKWRQASTIEEKQEIEQKIRRENTKGESIRQRVLGIRNVNIGEVSEESNDENSILDGPVEKQNIQEIINRHEEHQRANDNYYASAESEKQFQESEVLYISLMTEVYGEDWEEVVPSEKDKTIKLIEPEIIDKKPGTVFKSEKIGGTYTIETPEGEKIEGLTEVEFKEVSKSKEARDNLIDMKHTCEDCGLDYFWEERSLIFTAIGNMNTLGFDVTDGNYISPAELKFILTAIVSSIGDELGKENESKVASLKSTGSLGEAINIVKEINGTGGILATEDAIFKGRGNIKGYSLITRIFRDKFIPENSSQIFNHSRFQESLTS